MYGSEARTCEEQEEGDGEDDDRPRCPRWRRWPNRCWHPARAGDRRRRGRNGHVVYLHHKVSYLRVLLLSNSATIRSAVTASIQVTLYDAKACACQGSQPSKRSICLVRLKCTLRWVSS